MNKRIIVQEVDLEKLVGEGIMVIRDQETCNKIMNTLFTSINAKNVSREKVNKISTVYMQMKKIIEGRGNPNEATAENFRDLMNSFYAQLANIMGGDSSECEEECTQKTSWAMKEEKVTYTVNRLTEILDMYVKNNVFAKNKVGYVFCIPQGNSAVRFTLVIRKTKETAIISVHSETVPIAATWKEANYIGKKFTQISEEALRYLVKEWERTFELSYLAKLLSR